MKFSVKLGDPMKHRCSALVVGVLEDETPSPHLTSIDKALDGALSAMRSHREFAGKVNQAHLLHTLGRLPAERILLVGLGKKADLCAERLRQGAGTALKALKAASVTAACSLLHCVAEEADWALKASFEGFALAGYSFDAYKTQMEDGGKQLEELFILVPDKSLKAGAEKTAEETRIICDGVFFARDLVSHPGNIATPEYLADRALEMSGKLGIRCHVLERSDMEREGMGAILGVAKGSHQAPKLIVLEYSGAPKGKLPIAFVGKGVTFDSGGISLKPREGMEKMKDDMAGAAAVMGAMMAAAGLKLPINLVAVIPSVENLPGGGAYKPGDILRSMSGRTIEIVNTDAEGRLILCDALHYAQRYKPAALIDVATLTGGCVVALGNIATGIMGNDELLKKGLKRAGDVTGERVWELPLWEEYGELIKSDVADLKNSAGPAAASISAACFLQKFVGKSRWAHLDIAGTAWEDKGRAYQPKGATGVGVRLLVEYLRG